MPRPAEPQPSPTALHRRAKAIFHAALARPRARRDEWLTRACAGHAWLMREVHSLLRYHEPAEAPLLEGSTARLMDRVSAECRAATFGRAPDARPPDAEPERGGAANAGQRRPRD